MQLYQQGDVLLTRIEITALPGLREPGLVLAAGETTGHHHTAAGEGVVLFKQRDLLFLHAPNGAEILHPEHRTIRIPPGNYRIDRVHEYDHFGEQLHAERREAWAKAFRNSPAATQQPQSPRLRTATLRWRRTGRPVRD
jgi:hypothetical protein